MTHKESDNESTGTRECMEIEAPSSSTPTDQADISTDQADNDDDDCIFAGRSGLLALADFPHGCATAALCIRGPHGSLVVPQGWVVPISHMGAQRASCQVCCMPPLGATF